MGGGTGDARQVELVTGPTPTALTETLAALRKRRTGEDGLPAARLQTLGFDKVWEEGVRLIGISAAWNMRFFLVPGAILNFEQVCSAASPDARANLGAPLISMDIYDTTGRRVGAVAYTVDDIREGRVVRIFPLPATDERGDTHEIVFGVVPDGVSWVKVKAGDMPAQFAQVHDNFFEVEPVVATGVERRKTVTPVMTTITWYDESGQSVKTVSHGSRQMWLLDAKVELPEA